METPTGAAAAAADAAAAATALGSAVCSSHGRELSLEA
jgi:hypothetical protein